MSRIGKKPILIPDGVTLSLEAMRLQVKGPRGSLELTLPEFVTLSQNDGRVTVSVGPGVLKASAQHGLWRQLVANMVLGVYAGFKKELEIQGAWYKAVVQQSALVLSLGFAHEIRLPVPPGISVSVKENIVTISGNDKSQVGQLAATVRALRPVEPYKGKGIRYVGEKIRRKEVKAAKA